MSDLEMTVGQLINMAETEYRGRPERANYYLLLAIVKMLVDRGW